MYVMKNIDVQISCKTPGYALEPAFMFAHPTRLADTFTPAIERIYLPEQQIPSLDITIKVSSGHTGVWDGMSTKRKLYNRLFKPGSGVESIDYSGQFVFDARFDTDKNPAHIIDNVLMLLLYARQELSKHLKENIKIHVVLKEEASNLARQAYDTLDIPIICTDGNVYGNIVEVFTPKAELSGIIPESFVLVDTLPETFGIEIKGYKFGTPERVFIPRRGNRRLINNDEVAAFLESKGFTTCYFEDLTPSEEWSIIRNAKAVVAVHGAACSHIKFNRLGLETPDIPGSGVRMIELFSPAFTLSGHRYVSSVLNGRWCAVRGQITPEIVKALDFSGEGKQFTPLESPIKDPFLLDLSALQLALEYLEIDS
jgi:hypothetical protein